MKRIPLGGKQGKGKFALVDDEDYDLVSQFKWYVPQHPRDYARTNSKKATRYCKSFSRYGAEMHHLVLKYRGSMQIDHIDGDSLNNQKSNLRFCNRFQNQGNSKLHIKNKSGYRGVCWHKENQQWRASIGGGKHMVCIGYFDDLICAVVAYDQHAIERYREFARPNLLTNPYC
jgi:hypothetical protein